jgi:hypothetical protein
MSSGPGTLRDVWEEELSPELRASVDGGYEAWEQGIERARRAGQNVVQRDVPIDVKSL